MPVSERPLSFYLGWVTSRPTYRAVELRPAKEKAAYKRKVETLPSLWSKLSKKS
jgi:hypothetical protein